MSVEQYEKLCKERFERIETKLDSHDGLINKINTNVEIIRNQIEEGLIKDIFEEITKYRHDLSNLTMKILDNEKTIVELVKNKTISKANEAYKTMSQWNSIIYKIFFFSLLGGGALALGVHIVKAIIKMCIGYGVG